MALCRFIYGVIKQYLCDERELHVHYISLDDLVITTLLIIWSCSGRPGASRVGARCRFAAVAHMAK